MSFPISPTDGQTTTVNGIPYTYSLAKNSWTRTPQPVGNLTVTGNLVANVLYTDYGIRWAGNGAAWTSGGGALTIKSDLVTYTTSGTFYGNADIGFTVSAIGGVGIDDIQYAITLPVGKTITFLGNTYNDQEVHLVSNGYVYFAPVSTGITEYYLPGPGQVNVPAVFIGASDWSIQKYYYGIANGTDTFVIGYEGTINTTGNITASPSMKWELQFDLSGPDNNNQLSIVLDNSISNSNFYSLMATYAGGVWGISDGNQWLDRINPMPWWGWNDTSNDYAYHYKANINTMPADITAGKLAFVGPGVNVVTDGDTDFINIDPFDGLLSLNFDDNNAIAVLSSQHYGLRITNAQADNPIEIKPSLRGYVEIAGGDTSANQDGQAGNVYIRGGTATGVGDKHGAVYVLTGTGVNPWIFGENGLTFPDGNVQTTAYTGGGGGGSYANADVKIYLESLSNVNIGVGSGSINQGADSVAIGPYAGNTSQKDFSIAIGSNGGFTGNYYAAQDYAAGGYNQNLWATAIGAQAGAYEQGAGAIAIGTGAGARTQGVNGIAIGEESGAYWQGKESIAIGIFAGSDHQGENSTAMGYAAGKEYQGTLATALGTYAGYVNQSNLSVAIGSYAGFEQQGNLAIAIGPYAGNNTQSDFSIAIGSSALQGNTFGGEGYSAGGYNQGYNSVAIGPQSGAYNQGNYAVAIGDTAGVRDQQNTAIAIGLLAGQINQNYAAIAIGESAGASDQGADSVAIGFIAGRLYQGTLAIAIGSSAGRDGQGINSIALGREAGDTTQGNLAIAIGPYAGNISQGAHAVAIGGNGFYGNSYASEGYAAGGYNQGAWATAVGVNAGAYNQGTDATALGDSAGARNQGNEATAVGFTSGLVNQGQGAVAVGVGSGEQTQGTYSVAVGALAGANYQQELAIAIGKFAGRETQGYRSIAIGASAGYNNQAGNSIIITANGQVDSTTSGFFVDPIRNLSSSNVLYYNTVTKEITFDVAATTYSNVDVAAYLPTYSGNVDATITASAQPYIRTLANLISFGGNFGDTTAQGNLTVVGNLTVQGNTITVGSTNLTVTDSIIDLHTPQNLGVLVSDDGRDIGFRFHYYKGSDDHAFFGWENDTETLIYLQRSDEVNSNISGTYGNVQFGSLLLSNTTAATSTTTGAFQVRGGAGVAGALWIQNTGDVSANLGAYQTFANANVSSLQNQITGANTNIQTTSANLGAFQTYANSKIGTNTNSNLVVPATTTSTSTTTGALVVGGGIGVAGNISIGAALGVGTAASGTTGEIRATNNITAYYSSDARFKENVRPIPNALDKVLAIGGKLFDWTDEYIESHGGADGYFVRKQDFGVIGQDVQQVFPEGVRVREDGSVAVDYEKLSALAFAAIAELTEIVNELKSR